MPTRFSVPRFLLSLGLALTLLAALPGMSPSARAQSKDLAGLQPGETGRASYDLTELAGVQDIVLRGVHPSYVLYAPLPAGWDIRRATLRLQFEHSGVLRPVSTLTVSANDLPVTSVSLTSENAGPATLDIELPLNALAGDSLALKFSGFMRMSDDLCLDWENEANWVRIAAASSLEYEFGQLAFEPDLGRFPDPFVSDRAFAPAAPVFVIPPEAGGSELAPMLEMAGLLGANAGWRGLAPEVVAADQLDAKDLTARDYVLVGRTDRLATIRELGSIWPLSMSGDGTFADETGRAVSPETGVIMLVPSPWNPAHALLAVTGSTDAAVTNAAQALRRPEFPGLARGSYSLVPTAPEVKSDSAVDWGYTTLAALGYPTQTVRGLGKHNLNYTLDLPSSRLPESLKAFVAYSHSPLVSTQQSFLVLSINGIPQGGVYLNQEDGRIGLWEVTIPADQLRPGRNSMDLLFELYPTDDSPCDDLYLDRAWGVVYTGTALQASFSEGSTRPDLSILPAPFDSGTLVVLPNRSGAEERAASFRLFAELGSRMGARAQGMQVVTADQVSEEMLKGRHVILIGQPDGNPWLAAAMPLAPVKFDGGLRSLQADKINLSLADGEAVGLLEVFVSPWDAAHAALVITGTSDPAVGWASDLLSDPVTSAGLRGDVAIVDSRGTLTAFDSRGPVTPSNPLVADESAMRWVQIGLIAFFGLLALALLVVLVIRRRSR